MKIGDTVTWTHSSQRGNTIKFAARSAKVIQLTDNNVTVKFRGKLVHLRPDTVRLAGTRLELTEMIMGKW